MTTPMTTTAATTIPTIAPAGKGELVDRPPEVVVIVCVITFDVVILAEVLPSVGYRSVLGLGLVATAFEDEVVTVPVLVAEAYTDELMAPILTSLH